MRYFFAGVEEGAEAFTETQAGIKVSWGRARWVIQKKRAAEWQGANLLHLSGFATCALPGAEDLGGQR